MGEGSDIAIASRYAGKTGVVVGILCAQPFPVSTWAALPLQEKTAHSDPMSGFLSCGAPPSMAFVLN